MCGRPERDTRTGGDSEVVPLKTRPHVDGVQGRKLYFTNSARVREVYLRFYRVPHLLCEPVTAGEAKNRGWASVRGRIRPPGQETVQVEDAVRRVLVALVDPNEGEQVD